MIRYSTTSKVTADQFIDVLQRSTLSERRPVEDRDCMEAMVSGANLTVTAWQGDVLVGVARSVTDFCYCCYLSDLAVDQSLQRQGIGQALIRLTMCELGLRCKLILLSAPAARDYYPHVGFERHEGAWVLRHEALGG